MSSEAIQSLEKLLKTIEDLMQVTQDMIDVCDSNSRAIHSLVEITTILKEKVDFLERSQKTINYFELAKQ